MNRYAVILKDGTSVLCDGTTVALVLALNQGEVREVRKTN